MASQLSARTEETSRGDSASLGLERHLQGGGGLARQGRGERSSAGEEGGGDGELHDFRAHSVEIVRD
jgi:hypothetical protein